MSHRENIAAVQAKYPGWKIWRARRSSDPEGQRTGDFYASLIDQDAGVDPTVAASTPEGLDDALRAQAEAAEAGRQPYSVHGRWLS